MAKVSGRVGISLIPDHVTVRQVCEMGKKYAGKSADPSNVHFTLYNCAGMKNVVVDDVFRRMVELPLRAVSEPSDAMFTLSHVYLHEGGYVLWHASVTPWVKQAHQLALKILSPYVTESQLLYEVDSALRENPKIKPRELELVKKFGRRYVGWRDQPHFMCGLASEEGARTLQNLKKKELLFNHLGCFTHLALTVHGDAGKLEQILAQVPIISAF